MVGKSWWGRPKGVKQSEETKEKIRVKVKKVYEQKKQEQKKEELV